MLMTDEYPGKEAGKQTDRLHRVWPHSGRNTAPQGQGARWQVTRPRHLHLSPSPDAGCLWKGVRVGLKAGPVFWVLPGRVLWGPPPPYLLRDLPTFFYLISNTALRARGSYSHFIDDRSEAWPTVSQSGFDSRPISKADTCPDTPEYLGSHLLNRSCLTKMLVSFLKSL